MDYPLCGIFVVYFSLMVTGSNDKGGLLFYITNISFFVDGIKEEVIIF